MNATTGPAIDRPDGRLGARRIYQILARVYGTDGALPSSRALANELGVARSTVTPPRENSRPRA